MPYLPETAGERELRQPRDPEPIVTALRRIDPARAVADVQVGGICIKSLWVVDTDTPREGTSPQMMFNHYRHLTTHNFAEILTAR